MHTVILAGGLGSDGDFRSDLENEGRYDILLQKCTSGILRNCQLAREAIAAKDYDEAIGHLKFAARKRKDEPHFCALLGFAYLQKGDENESRLWMARAEKLAATDELKRIYSTKIDRLIAQSR